MRRSPAQPMREVTGPKDADVVNSARLPNLDDVGMVPDVELGSKAKYEHTRM